MEMLSTLHTLFSSTTVKKQQLLGFRCGGHSDLTGVDDEKWAEKAVETLVNRLNRKSLEKLLRAISKPSEPSDCVTIARTNDGRMQIANRKMKPHLLYCKLWRWADLRSHHELRALDCCKYPFENATENEEVCVNPYHYRRADSLGLPEIYVSKNHNYHQQESQESFVNERSTPENVEMVQMNNTVVTADSYDEILSYLEEAAQSFERGQPQQQPQQIVQTNAPYTPSSTPDSNAEAIPYQEASSWATIAYYELNSRVGQLFHCTQPIVTVDGYTDPVQAGNRFCLGSLANVNRNSASENVRQHIGQGIHLHYVNNGELYVECASAKSIFVQSWICNRLHNYKTTSVVKVMPGRAIKIFDNTYFGNVLSQSVQQGFQAVYQLIRMCTIRMSFVKGWGADYHREDVTTTPCWIEITMNGPLKWLDNVLIGMGSPPNAISSVS